jgi:hypothetical protein
MARDERALELQLNVSEALEVPGSRAPIMVDISYLPLMAFKALVTYAYTQNMNSVLEQVSAFAPIPSSPLMGYNVCGPSASSSSSSAEKEGGARRGAEGEGDGNGTYLFLDELLRLAHRFEVRNLFEICARMITLVLTIDNAIPILVQLGSEFEEIKGPVLEFIRAHFQEIFGQSNDDHAAHDPLEPFQDRPESLQLMKEIFKMMIRK